MGKTRHVPGRGMGRADYREPGAGPGEAAGAEPGVPTREPREGAQEGQGNKGWLDLL